MKRTPNFEIFIDGASRGNPGPAGVGAVCFNGSDAPLWQVSRYIGETTNNVAEYLALIYALSEAQRRGQTDVAVKTDSQLLARQLSGQYKVRDPRLQLLHQLASRLLMTFGSVEVVHIPREQNALAD